MKHQRCPKSRRKAACSKLGQDLLCTAKQRAIDCARRKRGERPQLRGKRENDVEVPDVEHSCPAFGNPFLLGQRLTFRTVPIATGIVRWVFVAARLTLINVTSESRGAALGDVRQDTLLLPSQPNDGLELSSVITNDVRDVEAPGPLRAG